MVSLLLFIIWGLYFLAVKKYMICGYVYFAMLAFMLLPPTLASESLNDSWYHDVDYFNIIVFALFLCLGYYPWKIFDKNIYNIKFTIPRKSIKRFKILFISLIIISFYSIIYLAPIAIKAMTLGAGNVRQMLHAGEYTLIQSSIFMTMAVAGGFLNIYAVLFFYISCLTPELKKYRIWLVLSSLSNIVAALAITQRDQLVFLPILYIIFYLIFKKSFEFKISKSIKKRIHLITIAAASIIIIFSLSRFAGNDENINWDRVYSGTFGYINQQPYVFDETIKGQTDFWGFEVRFPLINRILGIEQYSVNRKDNSFEWSFSTMYGEHYSAFGWIGLIGISLVYVLFYSIGFKILRRNKNPFGLLLLFTVFCFISVSGMFYTRAGGSVYMNIFFIALSIIPFLFPKNFLQSHRI